MEWFDTNGDGWGDFGAADTNGDGLYDTVQQDTNVDGIVDSYLYDTNGDGVLDTVYADADQDGYTEAGGVDTNGDGNLDTVFDASTGYQWTFIGDPYVGGAGGTMIIGQPHYEGIDALLTDPRFAGNPQLLDIQDSQNDMIRDWLTPDGMVWVERDAW